MIFVAVVKGDVSLLTFVSLSFVYRKATDLFWVNLVSCNIAEGVYQLVVLW